MDNQFSRTRMMFSEVEMNKLFSAKIAVFGAGGVGSYTIEALARAGIGHIDVIDNDVYTKSNINRQLYALHSTIGQYKANATIDRINDINPSCCAVAHRLFYASDTADSIDLSVYDYVVDAIDSVTSKLLLVERCTALGVSIISCMGTGNKLDPTQFEVSDIYSTSVCPLARVMRSELKKRRIAALKVVYSREIPIAPTPCYEETVKRQIPSSNPFVPPVAGMIIAGEVIKDIIGR